MMLSQRTPMDFVQISAENHFDMIRTGETDVHRIDADGRSVLFEIIAESRIAALIMVIRLGADVNMVDNRGVSPLMVASRIGCIEAVLVLVQNGSDVNYAATHGESALYLASEQKHLGVVQCLVEHGANVNQRTTSLHARGADHTTLMASLPRSYDTDVAGKNKSAALEITMYLLRHGADVAAQDSLGNTALHLAAEFGDAHAVALLAENGANLHIRNHRGQTPFDVGINATDVVTVLLLYGYNLKYMLSAEMQIPCLSKSHQSILASMLNEELDKNKNYLVCQDQNIVIQRFEDTDANSDSESSGMEPETLTRMCRRVLRKTSDLPRMISRLCAPESIKRFIGLNHDFVRRHPLTILELELAIKEGSDAKVETLLRNRDIDVNFSVSPMNSVTLAAHIGNVKVFSSLHTYGADLCALDNRGSSAIHVAAASGHVLLVKTILEHGVHVDMLNDHGETAIIKAAEAGEFEMVGFLLKSGSNPNTRNRNGAYHLHFAAASGDLSTTETLLRNGALINTKDSHDNTPLHVAASRGLLYTCNQVPLPALFDSNLASAAHDMVNSLSSAPSTKYYRDRVDHLSVVKLLLTSGANPSLRNLDNKTPYYVAVSTHSDEISDLL